MRNLPPQVEAALNETGLPWQIVAGKKHRKVYVAGQMVLVLSHGSKGFTGSRQLNNAIADIRKGVRRLQA